MFEGDSSGSDKLPGWLQQVINESEPDETQVETVEEQVPTEELPVITADTKLAVERAEPVEVVQEPAPSRSDGPQRQTGSVPTIRSPVEDLLDEEPKLADPFERSKVEKRSLVLSALLTCFFDFMVLRGTTEFIWVPLAIASSVYTIKKLLKAQSVKSRFDRKKSDG